MSRHVSDQGLLGNGQPKARLRHPKASKLTVPQANSSSSFSAFCWNDVPSLLLHVLHQMQMARNHRIFSMWNLQKRPSGRRMAVARMRPVGPGSPLQRMRTLVALLLGSVLFVVLYNAFGGVHTVPETLSVRPPSFHIVKRIPSHVSPLLALLPIPLQLLLQALHRRSLIPR